MNLELTPQEMDDLWTCVEARVFALQVEAAHSESPVYNRGLREALQRVERLRARVAHVIEMASSTEGLPQL